MTTDTDIPVVCVRWPTRPHRRNMYCINPEVATTIEGISTAGQEVEREWQRRATQPAPASGEWSLSSEVVNVMVKQDRIRGPLTCIDIPKHYGAIAVFAGAEVAARIVAEHNAVPKLVAALEDMIDLWARGQKIINGQPRNVEYDSQVIAAREAIALTTTTQPIAEEGQG